MARQPVELRLRKLAGSGLIFKNAHFSNSRPYYVYSLSEKAHREYVLKEGINDRRVQLASEVLDHDLTLVDIRKRFCTRPSVQNFFTENIIQSHFELADSLLFKDYIELRSDAVAEVVLGNQNRFIIPIEYEASLKSKDRNQKKILDYYIKHDGNAVIFICKNESILKALSDIEIEVSKEFKSKLYFSLLENVLSNTNQLKFINAKKDKEIII